LYSVLKTPNINQIKCTLGCIKKSSFPPPYLNIFVVEILKQAKNKTKSLSNDFSKWQLAAILDFPMIIIQVGRMQSKSKASVHCFETEQPLGGHIGHFIKMARPPIISNILAQYEHI
jgi:hypothetical protein